MADVPAMNPEALAIARLPAVADALPLGPASPAPRQGLFKGVLFLGEAGRPLRQIARELGIAPSRRRAWRNKGDAGQSPRRPNTPAAIPRQFGRRKRPSAARE
jgi:hypothetical protein